MDNTNSISEINNLLQRLKFPSKWISESSSFDRGNWICYLRNIASDIKAVGPTQEDARRNAYTTLLNQYNYSGIGVFFNHSVLSGLTYKIEDGQLYLGTDKNHYNKTPIYSYSDYLSALKHLTSTESKINQPKAKNNKKGKKPELTKKQYNNNFQPENSYYRVEDNYIKPTEPDNNDNSNQSDNDDITIDEALNRLRTLTIIDIIDLPSGTIIKKVNNEFYININMKTQLIEE